MSASATTATTKRIMIGGYAVDVRCDYDDPRQQAIIFIHGIGVSGKYFLPLANELAANYRIVAVDLPGYGKTPKPKQPLSIRQLADVVNGLTDEMQLHMPVIVGHSMGCQIAAHAVEKAPGVYKKMILLAPTIYANERTVLMQIIRLTQDMFYEPIGLNIQALCDYLRMGPWRYWLAVRDMLGDKIEQTLVGCRVPVLIMRGSDDKIVPADWVRTLQASIPDSTVIEIKNAPHAVQYKSPKTVARACAKYIV